LQQVDYGCPLGAYALESSVSYNVEVCLFPWHNVWLMGPKRNWALIGVNFNDDGAILKSARLLRSYEA